MLKKESVNNRAPKVLFVDDEPAFLDMYQLAFGQGGFEVRTAKSADNVYEIARAFGPDIMFLDLVMAGEDGLAILKKLKAAIETKWIPIVMLSNINNPADKEECMKEGASQFLIKSDFTPSELLKYAKGVLKMV